MKYIYREGARIARGVTAAVAGKELERIRRKHGAVKPSLVLEEIKDEAHPLHPICDWDDAVAGRKWRLQQIRTFIRAVLVVDKAGGEPHEVFIHVPKADDDEGEYQPVEVVVANIDMFTLALAEALKDVASAQQRVAELRRYTEGNQDRTAVVALAAQALATADSAIRALH